MYTISHSERGANATDKVQIDLEQAIALVLAENQRVLESVSSPSIAQFLQAMSTAKRIFVEGEGRSGLAMRMAAMRMMHLGLQDYVVGETITPSIQSGDLLITCSGSGETESVVVIATKAKEIGAQVVAITTQANSSLGKIADILIQLNAAAKQDRSKQQSQQFAGSLFEQSTLLLLDSLFHLLAQHMDKTAETLWGQHTNLE
jgi:6-phospho-3-hexuloisomerase